MSFSCDYKKIIFNFLLRLLFLCTVKSSVLISEIFCLRCRSFVTNVRCKTKRVYVGRFSYFQSFFYSLISASLSAPRIGTRSGSGDQTSLLDSCVHVTEVVGFFVAPSGGVRSVSCIIITITTYLLTTHRCLLFSSVVGRTAHHWDRPLEFRV